MLGARCCVGRDSRSDGVSTTGATGTEDRSSPAPSSGANVTRSHDRSSPRQSCASLEAAISALGSADGLALNSLQEASQKAIQATHRAIGLRSKHRVPGSASKKTDAKLQKIQTERAQLAAELAD